MIMQGSGGKYRVVMILSEHDTQEEATTAMLAAMNKESKRELRSEVNKLRKQGINAVTFEEAVKGMSPEELERFMQERQKKFINPIIDANINILEKEDRKYKIKRIK